MKKSILLALACLVSIIVQAQMMEPVKFSSTLKNLDNAEAEIVFSATIDDGWHVYSTELGQDGPISASLHVNRMEGAELVGKLRPRGKEVRQFDPMFGMELRFFEHRATFVQRIRYTKPQHAIDVYLEYGACNDQMCMPPSEVAFKQTGKSPVQASQKEGESPLLTSPKGEEAVSASADTLLPPEGGREGALFSPSGESKGGLSLYTPSIKELQAFGGADNIANHSWIYILLMGFVGGLLAVCMPCIWPIIPMTVSFFLKRAKDDKRRGIRDAMTYGLSIIIIYLALGLIITSLFGSDTLNAMSTNAAFNIFLFVLLVVFALSFFGWFELSLPDKWANAVDSKASSTSGLLSIFLMAFTLVLVSFSCTAPIVGLLLVETATSGNWTAPALGMFGFALALALPFTLFALFPSWLKQAPKSGSWMNTLKIVLGFIELAFALKFFSVADLAYGWHLLDREVFLSLWIVIFALLGAYLCGWLKFQTDAINSDGKPMPVVCIMGGLVSLAFAVYMLPGLWGAPCKAVSAFAPPMNTQDFNLNTRSVEAHYTDYETGMAAARAQGKPVLLDFTGFGCVNCRKMEAAVWTDPRVADMLTKDFILISLYVDDRAKLPQPFVVTENGAERVMTTVKEKNSWLQAHKFGANTQPFYVAVDADGRPLGPSHSYKEDVPAFLHFLQGALDQYKSL
ncbi:MAG: thioredoxin family protein [Prevotella sp.]|nr:thioredoxin family protein [Prevotella sp.]